MKLDTINTTKTNINSELIQFSIKQSPVMFDILSNKLYSNPILAIVRELITNAYDSHVVANTLDIPITIKEPSYGSQELVIRDYGTGLSKEDIIKIYTTFFNSTKCNDNNLTGGFGLGSKTPFAYTDTYEVNSYYNRTLTKYILFKNNGLPTITEVGSESTDEHNGLEIIIKMIEYKDISLFNNAITDYLLANPEIKTTFTINYDNITSYDNLHTVQLDSNYNCNVYIKQGLNYFNLDNIIELFSSSEYHNILYDKFKTIKDIADLLKINIFYSIPIGSLIVAPNREFIQVDTKNDYILIDNYITNLFTCLETMYENNTIFNTNKLVSKYKEYMYRTYSNNIVCFSYNIDYINNRAINSYSFDILDLNKKIYTIYCYGKKNLNKVISLAKKLNTTYKCYIFDIDKRIDKNALRTFLKAHRNIANDFNKYFEYKFISSHCFLKKYKVKNIEQDYEVVSNFKNKTFLNGNSGAFYHYYGKINILNEYDNIKQINQKFKKRLTDIDEYKNILIFTNKKDSLTKTISKLTNNILYNKSIVCNSLFSYLEYAYNIDKKYTYYIHVLPYKVKELIDIDSNTIIINLDGYLRYVNSLPKNRNNEKYLIDRIYERANNIYYYINKIYKNKKIFNHYIKHTSEYKYLELLSNSFKKGITENYYYNPSLFTYKNTTIKTLDDILNSETHLENNTCKNIKKYFKEKLLWYKLKMIKQLQ